MFSVGPSETQRIPLIGCREEPALSAHPPLIIGTLAVSVAFLALSLGPGPGAERHTQSAHHGSYPQRVQRLPAEHRRHRGRAAPLPPGAELGAHLPTPPIRDPRCYGIASGGFQRGDLITPDRLSARGRLSVTVWSGLRSDFLCVISAFCKAARRRQHVCRFTQALVLWVNIYLQRLSTVLCQATSE